MRATPPAQTNHHITVRLATREEREPIYRLRHEVYARELRQYAVRPDGRLTDGLDAFNHHLAVFDTDGMLGFVSVTPPGHGTYSMDKYFTREALPFGVEGRLYEVRLLTIAPRARGRLLALILMYAAFRWVESDGGERIVAMGRREVLSMYLRVGLKETGSVVQSGAVVYHLLQATIPDIHAALHGLKEVLYRVEAEVEWQLDYPFRSPAI